jgi:hypothetical protein
MLIETVHNVVSISSQNWAFKFAHSELCVELFFERIIFVTRTFILDHVLMIIRRYLVLFRRMVSYLFLLQASYFSSGNRDRIY